MQNTRFTLETFFAQSFYSFWPYLRLYIMSLYIYGIVVSSSLQKIILHCRRQVGSIKIKPTNVRHPRITPQELFFLMQSIYSRALIAH